MSSHRHVADLRPHPDYVLQTDIVERVNKANKAAKLEDTLIPFIRINRLMARDLLTLNVGNRDVARYDLKRYAMLMRRGKWFWIGAVIKIDLTGRLIDGQKELAAVDMSDTEQIFHIQCGIDPEAHAAIDVGRLKSLKDALTTAGFVNVNQLASTAKTIIYLTTQRKVSVNVEVGHTIEHQTVIDWCKVKANKTLADDAISHAMVYYGRKEYDAKFINQTFWSVIYFLFYKIDQTKAVYFLDKLASGEDMTREGKDWQILKLYKVLNDFARKGIGNGERARDIRWRWIFRAWNHWHNKEKNDKLEPELLSPQIEMPR
jgi:hypothetical protein